MSSNPDQKVHSRKSNSKLISILLIAACSIVILAGIHAAKIILAPIFMATFFAILLLPPLRWIRSKGISQPIALTIVISTVLIFGIGITSIVGTQLTQFARDLPFYRDRFTNQLMNYNIDLGEFFPLLKQKAPETEPDNPNGSFHSHPSGNRNGSPRYGSAEIRALEQIPSQTPNHRAGSDRPIPLPDPKEKENKSSDSAFANVSDSVPVQASAKSDEKTDPSSTEKSEIKKNPEKQGTTARSVPEKRSPYGPEVSGGFFDSLAGPLDNPASRHAPNKRNLERPVLPEEEDPEGLEDPGKEDPNRAQDSWTRASEDAMKASSHELFRFLAGLTGELSMLASNTFIIMLLMIFMLVEASRLPLKAAVALKGKKNFTNDRIRQLAMDIRHYMMIKTFVSILVGCFVVILLLLSNVQYAILWGFVAFLLNFIPNIGSVVAAIPPILLATVDHGLALGVIDAVFFVIINCGIGYILEPKLLGEGLDLSPLVVILSLLFCGWLLGPVGMFLSPPLAVIIKIILKSFPETAGIAIMMANTVPKEELPKPPEVNS
ncbi:MAG: AI-2E family transporter [Planctomycetia bacterium]|nr:AI-2E family transporter [Planctomycetia bacterium]